MVPKKLLIANRGEIAIRVMEAAAELGLEQWRYFLEDDARSLHVKRADEARQLRGVGAAAYLDGEQILTIAKEAGCSGIHPGYGFLSENAAFARRCGEEGLRSLGPQPAMLELFGDKVGRGIRAAMRGADPGGKRRASHRRRSQSLYAAQGQAAIVIKAVAGGGGRGMRVVRRAEEVEEAYRRCQSEARAAFGDGAVYVERFMPAARHIEVQILGDRAGKIIHLGERECTIQRRHQKLIEIAPSPSIAAKLRDKLTAAAICYGRERKYDSIGTFEFLVGPGADEKTQFAFIEANPRLQVEHTVTEEVTGVDLVKRATGTCRGRSLGEIIPEVHGLAPRGFAIEVRINAESMSEDGLARPSNGNISVFEIPSGPGVRVDSSAYAGYTTNPRFDSLIAKLIVHSQSAQFADAVQKAYRALCKFRIEGVATNLGFLQALLKHPGFVENRLHTGFVEENIAELVSAARADHRRLYFDRRSEPRSVGAKIDTTDPLAVLGWASPRPLRLQSCPIIMVRT